MKNDSTAKISANSLQHNSFHNDKLLNDGGHRNHSALSSTSIWRFTCSDTSTREREGLITPGSIDQHSESSIASIASLPIITPGRGPQDATPDKGHLSTSPYLNTNPLDDMTLPVRRREIHDRESLSVGQVPRTTDSHKFTNRIVPPDRLIFPYTKFVSVLSVSCFVLPKNMFFVVPRPAPSCCPRTCFSSCPPGHHLLLSDITR